MCGSVCFKLLTFKFARALYRHHSVLETHQHVLLGMLNEYFPRTHNHPNDLTLHGSLYASSLEAVDGAKTPAPEALTRSNTKVIDQSLQLRVKKVWGAWDCLIKPPFKFPVGRNFRFPKVIIGEFAFGFFWGVTTFGVQQYSLYSF